jgi:AcrR family transcriptional regulator
VGRVAGLRERKKEQARRRITDAALRLFGDRGFEAVTVNEIAESAEVAKATLFNYFPTKESLVLQGVADDDLATVVAGRPAGQPIVDALREHFAAMSSEPGPDPAETLLRVQIINASPVLRERATHLYYKQRLALAAALARQFPELTASLLAAQISAVVQTLQERYVFSDAPAQRRAENLGHEIEVALDLLHQVIVHAEGR